MFWFSFFSQKENEETLLEEKCETEQQDMIPDFASFLEDSSEDSRKTLPSVVRINNHVTSAGKCFFFSAGFRGGVCFFSTGSLKIINRDHMLSLNIPDVFELASIPFRAGRKILSIRRSIGRRQLTVL